METLEEEQRHKLTSQSELSSNLLLDRRVQVISITKHQELNIVTLQMDNCQSRKIVWDSQEAGINVQLDDQLSGHLPGPEPGDQGWQGGVSQQHCQYHHPVPAVCQRYPAGAGTVTTQLAECSCVHPAVVQCPQPGHVRSGCLWSSVTSVIIISNISGPENHP